MPLIGITVSVLQPDATDQLAVERYVVTAAYAHAVAAAGGEPVLLPPLPSLADSALIDHLDGILLSGGADVDPQRYGDTTVHPTTYGIHAGRDQLEIQLVQIALARTLPLLAICRGCQVLNVALGGTLYQDIPSMVSTSIVHRQSDRQIPGNEPSHSVRLTAGSRLAAIYGSEQIPVNSLHHQAVKGVGAGLVVSAQAEDGIIEGIELPTAPFVLGVQWHPELLVETHPEHRALFAAFVEAAAAYRARATVVPYPSPATP